jgi:hypothetical protein
MSTLRVNALQNVAGTGQPAMVGAAKAWVNFNGTGTVAIRSQFNVSSITDNGTGYYTINFSTALENTNYTPVLGSGSGLGTVDVGAFFIVVRTNSSQVPLVKSTTQLGIATGAANGPAAITDAAEIYVSIFST